MYHVLQKSSALSSKLWASIYEDYSWHNCTRSQQNVYQFPWQAKVQKGPQVSTLITRLQPCNTTGKYGNLPKTGSPNDHNNVVSRSKKLAETMLRPRSVVFGAMLVKTSNNRRTLRNYHSHGLWLSFNPFQYVGISAS